MLMSNKCGGDFDFDDTYIHTYINTYIHTYIIYVYIVYIYCIHIWVTGGLQGQECRR